MSIKLEKRKRNIAYYFYLSLFVFLIFVGWFVYSKWKEEKQLVQKKTKQVVNFDVTGGLSGIKIEEYNKILENSKYKLLRSFSFPLSEINLGKKNPFLPF